MILHMLAANGQHWRVAYVKRFNNSRSKRTSPNRIAADQAGSSVRACLSLKLVGRGERRAVPQTSKVVGACDVLAGGRHPRLDFGGAVMTEREELLRRALLQEQAATLLREDADRREAEARKLREEAALLEEPEP